MTARRAIIAALALLFIALVLWRAAGPSRNAATSAHPAAPSATPPDSRFAAGQPATDAPSATERSTLADALNSVATDTRADVRLVSDLLETFRSNFPASGNPTGTNAEITAALAGKNRLRLALVPPDHPAINREGELCDRWGTPFFFHAESATKMEIRSAGPDRKMWTDDDVTYGP